MELVPVRFLNKGSLGVPEAARNPRFFVYRASLLLTVGRVKEAEADIERVLSAEPENSDAIALQSIVAVAQNQNVTALDLARNAVAKDSQSATARVALSYAQQASFDLNGALSSLNEAIRLAPENALAWARLAELRLSFGKLNDALNAAQKAVALDPDLSRTQTVLGFAYLSQVKTAESRGAFEQAITRDQSDPLPRLGIGLSKIREGHLEEGRREIEIAMSLDPNNAIMRSYLGKAYYEEKRDHLATEQYSMAKQLDPLDPTAFFYGAIQKQTENRPVEALHDFQKAIDLNDNRAVYRSRLLLDGDLAARQAALARIYSDLGFQELALVEGWRSVNTDPSNYSAHRFLSDSYAVLPRQEIARVSELLQSQLLQPLNITPLQPHLAESNLLLIGAEGPSTLSYNEFNPLFNRNRLALQASGIVGGEDTYGEEVVVSGVQQRASFSVGQTLYQTDGWRKNSDQRDNIVNAFLQYQTSDKSNLQVEYRYRDLNTGDLALRFFSDQFLPGYRDHVITNTVRVGAHQSLSPGSDLLGSFMYQHRQESEDDTSNPAALVDIGSQQDAYSGELQHLFRSEYINTIIGGGYFNIRGDDSLTLNILITPGPPPVRTQINNDASTNTQQTNFYLYTNINYLKHVTVTLGGSVDLLRSDDDDTNQFNPKVGITWNPLPDTTLRAAAFRVLKRTLITDQTLEPTQVAGFNQFYDDPNGTESWRYGVAADQIFTQNIYGGAELSEREMKVPFFNAITNASEKVDWYEKQARAYLDWTPHRWVALSAEYMYEQYHRHTYTLNVRDVTTNRVPLGINFHHPSGLSAMLTATYYNQRGDFEPLNGPTGYSVSGKDDFWLVNAALSYRLPKRYGFLTVGATNLFDRQFNYFDMDPTNPSIQPGRVVYGRATFSL